MNKTISSFSINELYIKACNMLLHDRDKKYENDHKLYSESFNVTLELKNPYDHIINIPERNLSLKYLYGEFAFYMKGSNKLEDINKYSKFWNKISDNGKTVNSGYGHKLFTLKNKGLSQYEHAMYHLLKNPDTKRATMLINTPMNTVRKTKDTPCTMYLHFCINNDELHMTTHMRSNDIFFGTPYDMSFFTMLQEYTLIRLKEKYPFLNLGIYSHKTNSLHLYNKDYETVRNIAQTSIEDVERIVSCRMSKYTILQIKDFLRAESGKRPYYMITDVFLCEALRIIKGENSD